MNRSFWVGLSTGIVIAAVALIGRSMLHCPDAPVPRKLPFAAETPASPQTEAPVQLAVLEKELRAAKEEAKAERRRADDLQRRLAAVEDEEKRDAKDAEQFRSRMEERSRESAKEAASRVRSAQRANELRSLRSLQLGKDLPAEVVEFVDMDQAQQRAVNELFRRDGERVYASLRRLAATEMPGVTLPAEDGYDVAIAVYSVMYADLSKRDRWYAWKSSLLDIRAETLTQAKNVLTDEQQGRLVEVLGNWFSFEGGLTFPAYR